MNVFEHRDFMEIDGPPWALANLVLANNCEFLFTFIFTKHVAKSLMTHFIKKLHMMSHNV